ncbi:sigma E protease regulator RseP [Gayadomonas joobiniege]|uniref:sigma E protease regulator RseP n=1 Tax=Gayadomonas joobiniege TaxID=1234606 RepID=UPI00036F458F|nr:sigma E protease regulator RseP [Gayadomonas joobiniege]
MSIIWNLISFIIAISVLVTIHEYGHYKVARWCGVKVLRFSVGFGKPLWRWTNKDGVEFVIAALPFGGYVRMLDERVDSVKAEEAHLAFNRRPVLQRIAVVAAGPLANLLFAIVALWGMYMIGVPEVKPVLGGITQSSPASASGLQSGDQIVSVNGHKTLTWQQVNLELMDAIGDKDMQISILRPSNSQPIKHTLNLKDWHFDVEKGNLISALGLKPYRPEVSNKIVQVAEGSPAEKGGLKVGDRILAFGEGKRFDWEKISKWIAEHPEQNVKLLIERDGSELELSLQTGVRKRNAESIGYLGVAPEVGQWPDEYRFNHSFSVIDSLHEATLNTWRLITLSFSMIEKLVTGDVSYKSLSGPISIAQGAGQSAGLGVVYFLSFLALISVNLGIINLLPLPVLDGGHLVYYFIEFVTGKPVPEKIQEIGFRIGAALIFCLMSVAILNDLSRW